MSSLLTLEEVAAFLNISTRTVYDHAREWGGFYPGGVRRLRFRKEIIFGIMEGKEPSALLIQFPAINQARVRVLRSGECVRNNDKDKNPNKHGIFEQYNTDPNRHGLLKARNKSKTHDI